MKSLLSNTKLNFILILISLIIIQCSENKTGNGLIIRDSLIYKNGEDKPFTGTERAKTQDKIIEYEIVNGVKHGKFRIYYEDETLAASGQIENNKNTGKWQYFYKSGKLESEGLFKNDLPSGKWVWFYESGILKEEGEYISGERTGIWKQFNEKGELISEDEFKPADSTYNNQIRMNY